MTRVPRSTNGTTAGPPLRRATSVRRAFRLLSVSTLALIVSVAVLWAEELPEYRLKAAILYNFAQFTEWPAEVGSTLNLCIHGQDPFGSEIDSLQDKTVGMRRIAVQRKGDSDPLVGCQIVFVAPTAVGHLSRVLDEIRSRPVLSVADSPGVMRQGVILNLAVKQGKVTFEVNLQAARAAHLALSSKVLRLATDVRE